jgi:PAS domain-containing protein
VSSPIISDNQIVGCVVAFHDITARKQLEGALRQSERNAVARAGELEAIVEAMNDAILVFNREGRVIHANSAAWRFFRQDMHSSGMKLLNEHMTRYAVRDAHGNPLENDDTPLFRILRGETLTNDDSVDIFIRAADGRQVEVNISGAPFRGETGEIEGAVCIARDVTERSKEERYTRETAREALEQAAELEAIFEALTDVVLVYDLDGRILRGNAAARAFLARRDTFALLDLHAQERATYYDLRDADNQPLTDRDNPLIRLLAGETIAGADAVHITFRMPDGSEGRVQISGAPLRDRQGYTCGAVCVFKVVP